jgi:hypothetical protein
MSGGFTEADLARGSSLGCRLLTKPLDMTLFTAWLEEVEGSTPLARILFDWQGMFD